MKGLNEFAQEVHKGNVERGFYEGEKNIGEMIALIHSELSEALEADRKGKMCSGNVGFILSQPQDFKEHFQLSIKDSFEDEIADVMIRCLDLCAYKGIDIESHIKAKHRYNQTREYKHGKRY